MKYSIIIPHKNSIDTLRRLFDSIPESSDIEIILVDNSENPISREQVGIDRDYILLHSDSNRFAGGARNVGLSYATGKWLIFADADDFFTEEAFDIFNSYYNADLELIYFMTRSVYDDTLEESDRNIAFNEIIDSFINGRISEIETKVSYLVPWGKMVKRELVQRTNIRFDEVLAANDVMFSTKIGYYAEKFDVDRRDVYVVTTRRGSLSQRRDFNVTNSRYNVMLERNSFLKKNGLKKYQSPVGIYLYRSLGFGIKCFCSFIIRAIKYRQNIFFGARNWLGTARMLMIEKKKNKDYITN